MNVVCDDCREEFDQNEARGRCPNCKSKVTLRFEPEPEDAAAIKKAIDDNRALEGESDENED